MQSRHDYPFSPDFNIGTSSVINNTNPIQANSAPPSGNNFLLLDGSNFLLLDGSNFLLL